MDSGVLGRKPWTYWNVLMAHRLTNVAAHWYLSQYARWPVHHWSWIMHVAKMIMCSQVCKFYQNQRCMGMNIRHMLLCNKTMSDVQYVYAYFCSSCFHTCSLLNLVWSRKKKKKINCCLLVLVQFVLAFYKLSRAVNMMLYRLTGNLGGLFVKRFHALLTGV